MQSQGTNQVNQRMNRAPTETTTAMTPASPSLLVRAHGSAEDLMAQTEKASTRTPQPNATFDSDSGSASRPARAATSQEEEISTKHTTHASEEGEKEPSPGQKQVATANIKYKNQCGREAILAASTAVHHDFGALTSILNVTLPSDAIALLERDPNVEWVDGNGAVYFVQPY